MFIKYKKIKNKNLKIVHPLLSSVASTMVSSEISGNIKHTIDLIVTI